MGLVGTHSVSALHEQNNDEKWWKVMKNFSSCRDYLLFDQEWTSVESDNTHHENFSRIGDRVDD